MPRLSEPTREQIEAGARALAECTLVSNWQGLFEKHAGVYRRNARAVLTAAAEAQQAETSVPGFKRRKEMVEAAWTKGGARSLPVPPLYGEGFTVGLVEGVGLAQAETPTPTNDERSSHERY